MFVARGAFGLGSVAYDSFLCDLLSIVNVGREEAKGTKALVEDVSDAAAHFVP